MTALLVVATSADRQNGHAGAGGTGGGIKDPAALMSWNDSTALTPNSQAYSPGAMFLYRASREAKYMPPVRGDGIFAGHPEWRPSEAVDLFSKQDARFARGGLGRSRLPSVPCFAPPCYSHHTPQLMSRGLFLITSAIMWSCGYCHVPPHAAPR